MNLEELRKFNMSVKKEIAKIEGIEITSDIMKRLQNDGHSVKSIKIEKYQERYETNYVIFVQFKDLNKCGFVFSDFRMLTQNNYIERRYFSFENFGEYVAASSHENDIGDFRLDKRLYQFFPSIDLFKYFVYILSIRIFQGNCIKLEDCKYDETDIEEYSQEDDVVDCAEKDYINNL